MFFTRIPGKMIQFDLRIFFHWVAKKKHPTREKVLGKKVTFLPTGDFQCEAVKLLGVCRFAKENMGRIRFHRRLTLSTSLDVFFWWFVCGFFRSTMGWTSPAKPPFGRIPSLKLTCLHLNLDGWNTIVSFWDGLFSRAMLVLGSACWKLFPFASFRCKSKHLGWWGWQWWVIVLITPASPSKIMTKSWVNVGNPSPYLDCLGFWYVSFLELFCSLLLSTAPPKTNVSPKKGPFQ